MMGFSLFFFGHQWEPLGSITDEMSEIGILSGWFGSLTPVTVFFLSRDAKLKKYIFDDLK